MSKGFKGEMLDNGRCEERSCPVCGKNFIPTPQWVYKTPVGIESYTKTVCSYSCMTRAKRERAEVLRNRAEERKKERKLRGDVFCNGGPYKKRVICLNTGVIYDSVRIAAMETGCSASGVSEVCKGRRKATRGHRFKYYGEA